MLLQVATGILNCRTPLLIAFELVYLAKIPAQVPQILQKAVEAGVTLVNLQPLGNCRLL